MSLHICTCDIIWPILLDLSALECRQTLRGKDILRYSDVVSVLRAQRQLTEGKKNSADESSTTVLRQR